MTPDRIKRAAEVLREDAQALFECHTINGEWLGADHTLYDSTDKEAREAHDEMLALANELDALAGAQC